jgi:hypothetical protein
MRSVLFAAWAAVFGSGAGVAPGGAPVAEKLLDSRVGSEGLPGAADAANVGDGRSRFAKPSVRSRARRFQVREENVKPAIVPNAGPAPSAARVIHALADGGFGASLVFSRGGHAVAVPMPVPESTGKTFREVYDFLVGDAVRLSSVGGGLLLFFFFFLFLRHFGFFFFL